MPRREKNPRRSSVELDDGVELHELHLDTTSSLGSPPRVVSSGEGWTGELGELSLAFS
jgi:hypothetical protein